VGGDGGGYAGDLGQKGTEIFLQRRLDDPNHVDPLQQIALSAQRLLSQFRPLLALVVLAAFIDSRISLRSSGWLMMMKAVGPRRSLTILRHHDP
jgi:hypothetical protein